MMRTYTIFGLLALVSGAAGWWLHQHYPSAGSDHDVEISRDTAELGELRERIQQLEAELKAEKTHRTFIENQLAEKARDELNREPDADISARDESTPSQFKSPAHSSIPELDRLIAAGIPTATAEAIRDQVSRNRLARLRLRDRARREGWLNTSRYTQERAKLMRLSQDIREAYGDDIYDRYLYANERANRVTTVAVYPDSSAAASGIQTGDMVLSYAQNNIYSMNDLKNATLAGDVGESVLVVLERDGNRFSITVPRGPLGIEMRMARVAPE